MNNFTFIFLCLFTIVFSGTRHKENNVRYVEGIFYQDDRPVKLEITGGKITSITPIKKLSGSRRTLYIAPGFIDNQVNGYNGVAFDDTAITVEDIHKATTGLWKAGVTTYLPTVTTNDGRIINKNLATLAKAKADDASLGSIAGFHIEGPYISPVDGYRGAHLLKFVRKPDWNEFMDFYQSSGNNIIQVTLAPEVEGAMDFISKCKEKNIIVALGHHNASAQVIDEAIEHGAQTVTHIGNGIANSINRHVNPLWPQLADDRLMISMIGDGFHLLPEELCVFYKAKGVDRTMITSDVTSYAGMPAGEYITTEGEKILLTADGELKYPAQNVLYGSAAPITKGIGNVMKVTGCSLSQAVRMGSTNAARLYNFKDRGELKPGMRADIVLFDIENFNIHVRKTIVNGHIVYDERE
ncbi:MAG: amidohydrolase family protein [Chitinophagaceae bacterium]|nr:amidohydrolase family protein [Chitinophagaceae bacterium]